MQNLMINNTPKKIPLTLNELARRAGIGYPTSVSAGLAEFYRLSGPVISEDRHDLYDLMWAVASALNGCFPVRSLITPTHWTYWIEFYSILPGTMEPQEIQMVATVQAANSHTPSLHLSLPGETVTPPNLVLAVEDDEQVSRLIKLMLQRAGLAVIIAHTGREALHTVKDLKPDLILLDIDLPDITGLDILGLLKEDPKLCAIPVIFCTGRIGVKEEVISLGAVDCLEKPQDLPRLVTLVRHWLTARTSPQAPSGTLLNANLPIKP